MTESDHQWVLKDGFWSPSLGPLSLVDLSSYDGRRSLIMTSRDDMENDDTLDYSLFSFKPRLPKRSILRSSPVSASVCDITEAVNKSMCTGSQFQQRFRSRSSSISASSSSVSVSPTASALALSNYVTPVDIKSTKKRTKSFSPGSGCPPASLLGKYRFSENSFRSRSSSVSTASNSSNLSSSQPIPTERTEEFWNQYRRNPSISFIGKLVKRALSTRQGPCSGSRYIAEVAEGGVEESVCSENEDLYDEMYQEIYQDVFQEQSSRMHGKSRQVAREKSGIIL